MSSSISSFRAYTISVFLSVAVLSISLLAVTELLIRTRIIPNDSLSWHLDRFISGDYDNVVFGDSHTSMGVHGISGFLNLSFPADNYAMIEAKVKGYFADRQPGKVILEAEPHMFGRYWDDDKEVYEVRLFATKSRPSLWLFTGLHRKNISNYWKLFFQGSSFENVYTFQQDGALTQNTTWAEWPEGQRLTWAKALVSPIHRPKQEPKSTQTARAIERTLAFLTSRGAEVCMLGMPMSSLQNILSEDYPEFDRAREYFQSVAADYGVRYVDMSSAIIEDTLYFDSGHLNEQGALEFAPLLDTACFGPEPYKQPSPSVV